MSFEMEELARGGLNTFGPRANSLLEPPPLDV
jgi:hypothetical protein